MSLIQTINQKIEWLTSAFAPRHSLQATEQFKTMLAFSELSESLNKIEQRGLSISVIDNRKTSGQVALYLKSEAITARIGAHLHPGYSVIARHGESDIEGVARAHNGCSYYRFSGIASDTTYLLHVIRNADLQETSSSPKR